MSVATALATPSPARQAALALACALAWAAVWSAQHVGVWPAVGGAAIVLGAVVLGFDPTMRTLLRPNLRLLLIGGVAGAAMAAATLLAYPPLSRALPALASDTERLYAAFRGLPYGLVHLLWDLVVLVGRPLDALR